MPAHTKARHLTTAKRLKPPESLSEPALKVFEHVVGAVDPGHFSEVDMPLLESYATSAAMATLAAQMLGQEGAVVEGKANAWLTVQEKAQRSLVALSARLRICPQSRFDRLVAGSNTRPQVRLANSGGLLAGDDDELLAENPFARNGERK
jgi:phage terminase small subunit